MKEHLLVTFDSTNFAMQAESQLKVENMELQVIPTPREITRSCGLSIKTSIDNMDEVKKLNDNGKIKIKSMYNICMINGIKTFKEIGR
jgi:hypothetical protein